MKLLLPISLLALSTGTALAAGADGFASTTADGLSALGPVTRQSSDEEFRKKFREALELRATSEMEKLVRTRKDDAIKTVIRICEAISEAPSDALEKEIQGLRKAWKATHGSAFVNRQYEYFSLLKPNFKRTRKKLDDAYRKLHPTFLEASGEKNNSKLAECADGFTAQAEGFEEIGDAYMASLAWYIAGQCVDQELRGDKAELVRAAAAFEKATLHREKAGLKDAIYEYTKSRHEVLKESGFGSAEEAAEAAEAAAAAARAAAITLAPTFELFDDMGSIERPLYSADEIYQTWAQVFVKGNGSTEKFFSFGDDSPLLLREGAAKASVDLDGDGTGDVPVPVNGTIGPVQFVLGEGEEAREVAFLATVGRNDDTYQGFRQNLSPDVNQMGVYIAPAGSVVTEIEGTPIRILDDNLDGIYGSLGEQVLLWDYLGTLDKEFQPDIDSIVIGKSKKALPFSELIQIGETWYQLEVEAKGNRILASPRKDLKVGELKLKLKGPDVDYMILQGTGAIENVFIDLTANKKKAVTAPVGTYKLFSGRVSKGKRQQMMKALVLPSKTMNNFVVTEGETTEVELGSPFGFTFEYSQADDSVEVSGSTIAVTGMAGETYQRLWNCVPLVEVLARKKGGKKGAEIGKMRPSQSQEELQDNGWQTGWFPIAHPFEKGKLSGQDVEVQLFQKKNKLFGKIESDWKE